jgi:hypothetical protein
MPYITKPDLMEYKPFYQGYIDKMKTEILPEYFQEQVYLLERVYKDLSGNEIDVPQSPGKWSYNQLFGHLLDTEKIMHFRALMIARQPGIVLPGFDQDLYVLAGNFNGEMTFSATMQGIAANRHLIVSFLASIREEQLLNVGQVDGHPMSVRALLYIICGHMQHHLEGFYRSRRWEM